MTCHYILCMCLHVWPSHVLLLLVLYSMFNMSLLMVSSDVCCLHMCSLCTARCSGWSRSGCVDPTVVQSGAAPPGLSLLCLLSSMPHSSWSSGGRRLCSSRARPASLACEGKEATCDWMFQK